MTSLNDQTLKRKMMRARELIKAKQYAEARAILEEIDHPTARDWLKKLEQLAPQKPAPATPAKKGRRRFYMILALIVVSCSLFSVYILYLDSQLPDVERAEPTPRPTVTVCSGSRLIDCYMDQMTAPVQQHGGRVEAPENKINSDGRLESLIDVRLIETQNIGTARRVIEDSLRLYAGVIPPEQAGSIYIGVFWSRGDQQCGDNAGMGYRTMETINWETASQRNIFRAIDRNIYGDVDGPYSEIGFAPDDSGIQECNR